MSESTPAATWRVNGEKDPHAGRYDGERSQLALGKYTDDELANGAFMNYDAPFDVAKVMAQDPDYHPPIVWMTAVKDRIRWLSRKLAAADAQRTELLGALDGLLLAYEDPGNSGSTHDDKVLAARAAIAKATA
ncbi:hypothetical protein [Pseudomonas bohemica]|uniref:hypothetical protein n=1 Tax=Pseudomonas bohemica TaxID=2044872 RepID=UPI000DA63085|nr:hypothetical protein [Pseudomonas bohemica]